MNGMLGCPSHLEGRKLTELEPGIGELGTQVVSIFYLRLLESPLTCLQRTSFLPQQAHKVEEVRLLQPSSKTLLSLYE